MEHCYRLGEMVFLKFIGQKVLKGSKVVLLSDTKKSAQSIENILRLQFEEVREKQGLKKPPMVKAMPMQQGHGFNATLQ